MTVMPAGPTTPSYLPPHVHVPRVPAGPGGTGAAAPDCGGRLVAHDGRELPLAGIELGVEAQGGLARVRLVQRFRNPHAEPLRVTYRMPLPAEGAVSGYSFTLRGRRIVGEVDRKRAARERFEQALAQGRTAGIVDQERSSVFTQELGNLPPGEEVTAELIVDQRLLWAGDAWEWRFPTVIAPRYAGAEAAADQARLTVDVAPDLAGDPLAPRAVFTLAIADRLPDVEARSSASSGATIEGCAPESPTHRIRSLRLPGRCEVSLVEESGARLDRDVCVRWPVAGGAVGAGLLLGRRGARLHGLLTLVPPRASVAAAVPRDLIVLLDTSGSMSGEPLAQARRIVSALVSSLTAADRLELIEFSDRPSRFRPGPEQATPQLRRSALAWLAQLQASGGTEMNQGIVEALRPLRGDAQRQVVLVTDGLIGNEAQLLTTLSQQLPAGSRLHSVGVGSAVNRSLTGPAARAGRGVEVVVGLGEDAERATQRLLARTVAPVVTELTLSGSALLSYAPAHLPDLFAGAPALLGLELQPGGGELVVTGRTAAEPFVARLQVSPAAELGGPYRTPGAPVPLLADSPAGADISALYAREAVEDLELQLCAGGNRRELDRRIETLGLEFQIATRLTSWVAVSAEVTVDPGQPTRSERIAQELPHGMSIEGLGLREAAAAFPARSMTLAGAAFGVAVAAPAPMAGAPGIPAPMVGRARAVDLPDPGSAPQAPVEVRTHLALGEVDELLDEEAGASTGAGLPSLAQHADLGGEDAPEELDEEEALAPGAAAYSVAPPAARRAAASAPPRAREKTEKKKGAGLLSRMRRFFAGPPRQARGRVLLATGTEWLIEIAVEATLQWLPALGVELVTSSGRSVAVILVTTRSTGAGTMQPGQLLRLTLRLNEPLDPGERAVELRLTGAGDLQSVVLEA